MNKFSRGKINPLVLIFGVIILGSLMVTIISQRNQNKNLQVYNGENEVEVNDTHSTSDAQIDTFKIAYDYAGFSLDIPTGWEKVVRNGYDNYIHSPSASSVGIEIKEYEPYVNAINESTISTDITSKGFDFVSFERKTSSSYELIYQEKNNKVYDYIDEVIWSKDYIITLHFIVNDENFSKISPSLDTIYNSFTWYDDANTIPADILVSYVDYGDFEFAIPTEWTLSSEGNAIFSTNADNTAQMVLTISENATSLENTTSYDIASLLQPSRNNGFMLQSSESSLNLVKATAQYYNDNGIIMVNKTYIYSNGVFLYNIQFDYQSGALDDGYTDTLFSYFKEYYLEHNRDSFENATATDTDSE